MVFVKRTPRELITPNGQYSVSKMRGARKPIIWVACVRNPWSPYESWSCISVCDTLAEAKSACKQHAKDVV